MESTKGTEEAATNSFSSFMALLNTLHCNVCQAAILKPARTQSLLNPVLMNGCRNTIPGLCPESRPSHLSRVHDEWQTGSEIFLLAPGLAVKAKLDQIGRPRAH